MTIDVKNAFENIHKDEKFIRVDKNHPIDIYFGKDIYNRNILLVVTDSEPLKIESSSVIDVYPGKRADGKWALSFVLTEVKYYDVFCCFCNDIIESSRYTSGSKDGIVFICKRFIQWQEKELTQQ